MVSRGPWSIQQQAIQTWCTLQGILTIMFVLFLKIVQKLSESLFFCLGQWIFASDYLCTSEGQMHLRSSSAGSNSLVTDARADLAVPVLHLALHGLAGAADHAVPGAERLGLRACDIARGMT